MPPGIDLNVMVLTHTYWPSYPQSEAKLPAQLDRLQEVRSRV